MVKKRGRKFRVLCDTDYSLGTANVERRTLSDDDGNDDDVVTRITHNIAHFAAVSEHCGERSRRTRAIPKNLNNQR